MTSSKPLFDFLKAQIWAHQIPNIRMRENMLEFLTLCEKRIDYLTLVMHLLHKQIEELKTEKGNENAKKSFDPIREFCEDSTHTKD